MIPVAIDFFAGAGGLSEGFKQAGFRIAVANEINKDAAATYSLNHPDTKVLIGDIHNIKSRDIIKIVGRKPDIIIGGPPCQGFSLAGKRNKNDSRNFLFKEFIKKIKEIKPKFFLMENVTGIISFNKGKTIAEIEDSLKKSGYTVSKIILNAADFGVPQVRRRLFIFGALKSNININEIKVWKNKAITTKEAICDLDFLGVGESSNHYKKSPSNKYQAIMRIKNNKLHNHTSSRHNKMTIKRFSMLKPGHTMKEIPAYFKTKKRTLLRIEESKPINTITTIPDDYIHYSLNRTLTVRECARLQSFPDSYVFLGSRTTGGKRRVFECPQYTQVGNAVPPILAKVVGEWIKKQF
ncbi:MAG: Cytosine-specific methyltransferase [archaeon GW2011_AR20]|nr:MAG: Cytosine-specific methyltransferase [archaeon GW2011_AR20]